MTGSSSRSAPIAASCENGAAEEGQEINSKHEIAALFPHFKDASNNFKAEDGKHLLTECTPTPI
jgi:hypothetical protein